ncbi:hypothetical protein DL98DRAFT_596359 [Cadophora sp. DSE1049]|nr:hypothetical protein DL98DRAFT_596359 [Cadophora sp. DSE1049]
MASPINSININNDDASDLITLHSGDTPTDPFNSEAPLIQALFKASEDAEYQRALDAIPRDHRIKIGGIWYILYTYYRKKTEKKRVWYWEESQAEELLRVSKEPEALALYP